MNGVPPRIAQHAVRAWTRLYTWRLPAKARQRRIEEVESDLWEDAQQQGSAARTIARLLLGIADDVGWRIEQEAAMVRTRVWIVAITGALCGTIVAATWVATIAVGRDSPTAPPVPRITVFRTVAEPPPPPPPPPPPGVRPPASYSMIIYRVVDEPESPRSRPRVRSMYPAIERDARLEGQGRVVVRGTVDPAGRLTRRRIVRSIPAFDDAVLRILDKWPMSPATVDGRPVETEIVALARFRQ